MWAAIGAVVASIAGGLLGGHAAPALSHNQLRYRGGKTVQYAAIDGSVYVSDEAKMILLGGFVATAGIIGAAFYYG